MKMRVTFTDSSTAFGVQMAENSQAFSAEAGEVTVVHDGQNGATFIPAVSDDGILSWTNDRDLPNPEPVKIGVSFSTDETLSLDPETGVLSVNTADKVEADNTLPVTAAAVQTTVGNINVLLATI